MKWLALLSGLAVLASASTPNPNPNPASQTSAPAQTASSALQKEAARSQFVLFVHDIKQTEAAIAKNPGLPLTLAFGPELFKDRKLHAFAESLVKNPLYTVVLRLDEPPADQFKKNKEAQSIKIALKSLAKMFNNWNTAFPGKPMRFVALPPEAPQSLFEHIQAKQIVPIQSSLTLGDALKVDEVRMKAVVPTNNIIIFHRSTSQVDFGTHLKSMSDRLKYLGSNIMNAQQYYFEKSPQAPATTSTPTSPATPSASGATSTSNTSAPAPTPNSPQSATAQATTMTKEAAKDPKDPSAKDPKDTAAKDPKDVATPTNATTPMNTTTDKATENTTSENKTTENKTTENKTTTTGSKAEGEKTTETETGGISVTTILIIVGVAIVVIGLLAFAYKKMKN